MGKSNKLSSSSSSEVVKKKCSPVQKGKIPHDNNDDDDDVTGFQVPVPPESLRDCIIHYVSCDAFVDQDGKLNIMVHNDKRSPPSAKKPAGSSSSKSSCSKEGRSGSQTNPSTSSSSVLLNPTVTDKMDTNLTPPEELNVVQGVVQMEEGPGSMDMDTGGGPNGFPILDVPSEIMTTIAMDDLRAIILPEAVASAPQDTDVPPVPPEPEKQEKKHDPNNTDESLDYFPEEFDGLVELMRSRRGDIMLFHCVQCGMKCGGVEDMLLHLPIHEFGSTYIPPRSSRGGGGVRGMFKRNSTPKTYKCNKCSEEFTKQVDLRLHKKSHGNQEKTVYQCQVCPDKFTNKLVFKRHIQTHIRPSKINCEVCNVEFEEPKRKKDQRGPKKKVTRCRTCVKQKQTPTKASSVGTSLPHSQSKPAQMSLPSLSQPLPDYMSTFSSTQSITFSPLPPPQPGYSHSQFQLPPLPLVPDPIPTGLTTETENIPRKSKLKHPTKPKKAKSSSLPKVELSIPQFSQFTTPFRQPRIIPPSNDEAANSNKVHRCKIDKCCYATMDFEDFVAHQEKEHNRKYDQFCTQCPKKFSRRDHLTLHVLRHHTEESELPFRCTLCPKSFVNSYILKRHMDSHSGEKKYTCPVCQMAFGSYNGRYRHLQKIHGMYGGLKAAPNPTPATPTTPDPPTPALSV